MAFLKAALIALLAAAALAGSRAQVVGPEVTVIQGGTVLPLAGAAVEQVDFSEARPIVSVTAEPPCTTVLEVRRPGACPPAQQRLLVRAAAPTPVKAVLRRARGPSAPLNLRARAVGPRSRSAACSSLGAAPRAPCDALNAKATHA